MPGMSFVASQPNLSGLRRRALARDNEHVHAVAVRQLQQRLGYCGKDPVVAEFELKLEREGLYAKFLEIVEKELGKPWTQFKDSSLVDQHFSLAMHHLDRQKHVDPLSWSMAYAGKAPPGKSPKKRLGYRRYAEVSARRTRLSSS